MNAIVGIVPICDAVCHVFVQGSSNIWICGSNVDLHQVALILGALVDEGLCESLDQTL